MLQIPWFYFRIWEEFNKGASLRTGQLKNKKEIIRNASDWVILAERDCDYKKVMKYLQVTSNPLETTINDFFSDYIEGDDPVSMLKTVLFGFMAN